MINKDHLLREHTDDIQTDIVVFSESWLTNENTHWINRSELNEDCLRFRAAPRIDRRGGSLVLCTKIYNINEIEKGITKSFEFMV